MTEEERRAIEADCTRLVNHYANRNDAQDWHACADCYTQDAVFRRPSGGDPVVGRAAILESFLARPPRAQRHVMANTVVEVQDADNATAFSAIILYMGHAVDDGGLPVQDARSPLVGWYRDRLVRTAQGWKFAEREGGLDFRP